MVPWMTVNNVAEKVIWWLAGSALRGSILLAGAFVLTILLRRASASVKHWIWVLSLASTLLIAPWLLISSRLVLPILPAATPNDSAVNSLAAFRLASINNLDFTSTGPSSTRLELAGPGVKPNPFTGSSTITLREETLPIMIPNDGWLSWSTVVLLVWLAGAGFLLVYWIMQSWRAYRTIRLGKPITDAAWLHLWDELNQGTGKARHPVRLISTDAVKTPMTWGLWQPAIVLPSEAYDWTLERRRIVLLHEMAHITRRDYLTQWIAVISCAFNWFNPLVWQAMRQLAIQREQACDDRVLVADTPGTAYARHLLDIAQTAFDHRHAPHGMLSLVRRSHLGQRIQRILDARQSRAPLTITKAALLMVVVALALLPLGNIRLSPVRAQQTNVVLSLALPAGIKSALGDRMFRDFEAAHPAISVHLVDSSFVSDPATEMPQFFSSMQKYADSADVVYAWGLTPEATQAGYFLNLAPFASADASLNPDDFYPALWKSYQWDNGLWALPTSAYISVLTYDPAAFDKVGLPYPSDKWTLSDFVDAVHKLSAINANNTVTMPGFAVYKGGYYSIYRSFTGSNLVNTATVPNTPQLDTPGVESFLTAWSPLDQQGLIGADFLNSPMSLMPAQVLDGKQTTPRKAVLLPGGYGGLDTVDAFAVSAGTQYPEEAYALVKFLTTRAEFPDSLRTLPARKSLIGALGQGKAFSAEIQTLLEQGIANSFSVADLRYTNYLDRALNLMKTQNLSAQAALQSVESQAVSSQQAAAAQKSSLVLSVATPMPSAPLAAGKIALAFDVSLSSSQGLPNQALWDQLIQQFTSGDPQVGQITLTHGNHRLQDSLATADCFYLPTNAVPGAPADALLNLDPLIAADPNFNGADLLPSILDSVRRENKIWAYPLTIVPTVLQYDSSVFAKAGAAQPVNGWTIDKFVDALQTLHATHATRATPPFADYEGDGTSLLEIIAAYGGAPLDYRTAPVTINFTDRDTVNAIRQALDLARKGLIEYRALGQSISPQQRKPDFTTPMFPVPLDMVMFNQNRLDGIHKDVLYPQGSKFSGVTYQIGAAYISARAQNPEACYRWLSFLAQHPELFYAFPVRHSQLQNAALAGAVGPDVMAAYVQLDALLQDNRTIPFPVIDPFTTTATEFLARHWLFQAFDTYVLNNGDLSASLQTAQENARAFQACAANLPSAPIESISPEDQKPFLTCALKVDPTLQSQLGSGS